MLGKVFKYQMKSVSKILLLIYAALLVISAVIAFIVPKFFFQVGLSTSGVSLSASGSAGMMILFTYAMAVAGTVFATYIVLAIRFYRNMFTDEAYLTHTLPVKPGTHLLSHILVFCLWFLASILLVLLSLLILVTGFGGIGHLGEIVKQICAYYETNIISIVVILIQYCLVGGLITATLTYLAICIGNLFSPHKVVAAIVSFIVLYTVVQVLSMIVLLLSPAMRELMFTQISAPYPPIELIQLFGWTEVMMVILIILFWVPSYLITAKHLNLE